jgi:hypothetical protein
MLTLNALTEVGTWELLNRLYDKEGAMVCKGTTHLECRKIGWRMNNMILRLQEHEVPRTHGAYTVCCPEWQDMKARVAKSHAGYY